MREREDYIRGLLGETLKEVTRLSKQSEETGLKFRVKARAIDPFVDEVSVEYPNGKKGIELIESSSIEIK